MKTLLLNKDEVGELIDLDKIQEAVEDGYRAFNSGQTVIPDFMSVVKPGTHEGVDFKSGMDLQSGYMLIKASSGGYDKNPEIGLPTGMNTVMLFDANTSALLAVMDGTWITGCRTGAAGAISVKYLSRKDSSVLCVIGAGNQARRQLRAISRVRDFKEVRVWNIFPEELETYVKEMKEELGLNIIACETPEEAVKGADVIVTVTRGLEKVIQRDWIRPGTHITCVGADMPYKQEMFADVFKGAKIVNDNRLLCAKNGETHHAIEEGVIKAEDVYGEIGEIILGNKPGRENDEEITIFDTVGMAIQDIAMSGMLYKAAMAKGTGTFYEFFS